MVATAWSKHVHVLIHAALLGVSLSSFSLALMLVSLISRFSKDLNEVMATWQYIHVALIVGCITLAACWVSRKEQGR